MRPATYQTTADEWCWQSTGDANGTTSCTFSLNVDPREWKIGNNYQCDIVFESALPEVKRHLATFKKYLMMGLSLKVGR